MALIVVMAALAMFAQDILATLLVQAEARNRAGLAAILDAVQWGAGIATTTISVTALQGHSGALKAAVVLAVTAANITGSYTGVVLGKRLIKQSNVCTCGCPVHADGEA